MLWYIGVGGCRRAVTAMEHRRQASNHRPCLHMPLHIHSLLLPLSRCTPLKSKSHSLLSQYYSYPKRILCMFVREWGEFTDCNTAEYPLQSWREFHVVIVGFEIDISQVWCSIHAHFHIQATAIPTSLITLLCEIGGHFILPEWSNWSPSYQLSPVSLISLNKIDVQI